MTGKLTARVTTGQIYWGAVPFVVIQVIMVGLVIAFPQMVSGGLTKPQLQDPGAIEIRIPAPEAQPGDTKPESDAATRMPRASPEQSDEENGSRNPKGLQEPVSMSVRQKKPLLCCRGEFSGGGHPFFAGAPLAGAAGMHG